MKYYFFFNTYISQTMLFTFKYFVLALKIMCTQVNWLLYIAGISIQTLCSLNQCATLSLEDTYTNMMKVNKLDIHFTFMEFI